VDTGAALAFAADGATAAAGSFNAAWLAAHWLGLRARGRRLAALSLAVLNAGVAVQALYAQAMYTADRFGLGTAVFFETGPWVASRAAVFAGVLLVSILILRRAQA